MPPKHLFFWLISILLFFHAGAQSPAPQPNPNPILSYVVDPTTQNLQLFWLNDQQQPYASIERLKQACESKHQRLIFAMNGGMYDPGNQPKGLFIQQHHIIVPLDTKIGGDGNFYLKPNGVFYITTKKRAYIRPTQTLTAAGSLDSIELATQSGPMLVIDGQIHPIFKKGSANLNIRNGVGLLPGNKLLFAISKNPISFYDFAEFFKNQGCQNALYLDGFVSRTYLPEKNWTQTDGDFGVIIAVTKKD